MTQTPSSLHRDTTSGIAQLPSVHQADGLIDEIGLNMLKIGGNDVHATLKSLKMRPYRVIDVDTGETRDPVLRFLWRDGRVKAMATLGEGIVYVSGAFKFDKAPKDFPAEVVDRPMGEFFKHPALPTDLVIRRGWTERGCAWIEIDDRYLRFDAETGATW